MATNIEGISKARLKALDNETGKPYADWGFSDHLIHVIRVMSERCGTDQIKIHDQIFTIKEQTPGGPEFSGHNIYVTQKLLEECNSMTYWTILRRCCYILLHEGKLRISPECKKYLKEKADVFSDENVFRGIDEYNAFLEEMYLDGEAYKLQSYWGSTSKYIPDADKGDTIGEIRVDIRRRWLNELFEADKRRASECQVKVARSVGVAVHSKTHVPKKTTPEDPYFSRSHMDKHLAFFCVRNIYGYGPFDWGDKLALIIRAIAGDASVFERVHVVKTKEKITKMRSQPDEIGNIKIEDEEYYWVVKENRSDVPEDFKEFVMNSYRDYIPYLDKALRIYQENTLESRRTPAKKVGEYILDIMTCSSNITSKKPPKRIEHEFGSVAKAIASNEYEESTLLQQKYGSFDRYWSEAKIDKIYELIQSKTVDYKFADHVASNAHIMKSHNERVKEGLVR